MNKKILILLLVVVMATTAIFAQGAKEEVKIAPVDTSFTIDYPSALVGDFGESLVLDKKPSKIVCLSNTSPLIFNELDVDLLAINAYTEPIEKYKDLPKIQAGMSTVDTEAVFALEPDLVILGAHLKDKFGKVLEESGIPVYYSPVGPAHGYSTNKEESLVLAKAWGGQKGYDKINKLYSDVEERVKKFNSNHKNRSAMILFGSDQSYHLTSTSYFGSIVSMLPFNILSDDIMEVDSRLAPVSMEIVLQANPEVLFVFSPSARSTEIMQKMYDASKAKAPEIYNQLQAEQNGNVIVLSSEYVTNKGLSVIRSIDKLLVQLDQRFQD